MRGALACCCLVGALLVPGGGGSSPAPSPAAPAGATLRASTVKGPSHASEELWSLSRAVLRCRGGGEEAGFPGLASAAEIAMDASYWLDIGPRILKTVKDTLRATEKLLDHSAASARALHRSLEESSAQLLLLKNEADAASAEGGDGDQEEQLTDQMADLTLEIQEKLMVHTGIVTMLTRRAACVQETLSHAEQLIHGGVLEEIEQHLTRLTQRRSAEGGVLAQEARFERNFDRMAVDWLLRVGETAEARQYAKLTDVPCPALPKFEAAHAALDRMLEGDLGPMMRWCHKYRRVLADPFGGPDELLANLHLHQLAELLGGRRRGSLLAAIELHRWWLRVLTTDLPPLADVLPVTEGARVRSGYDYGAWLAGWLDEDAQGREERRRRRSHSDSVKVRGLLNPRP